MSVAVEIHDHRRIDAHRLQHRLEWRNPFGSVCHRLYGVRQVPMRAERSVAGERREAIAVGVSQHMRKRRVRCAVGYEKEHAHALSATGLRVRPWVVLTVFIPQLTNPETDAAAPRPMPQVPEVRREIARKE